MEKRTTKLGLLGTAAVILSSALAGPTMAQQVIDYPSRCAAVHSNANCQNLGPGNPYILAAAISAGSPTAIVSTETPTGTPTTGTMAGMTAGTTRMRCALELAAAPQILRPRIPLPAGRAEGGAETPFVMNRKIARPSRALQARRAAGTAQSDTHLGEHEPGCIACKRRGRPRGRRSAPKPEIIKRQTLPPTAILCTMSLLSSWLVPL